MKNSLGLLLVTCLTWYLQTTMTQPTFGKDHFTADCTATDRATITVDNGYTAVGHQRCNPTALTTTKYTLPPECVGNGAFIIRPTTGNIVVKEAVYSLSCIEDVKDDYVVNVGAVIHEVKEPTGTPIPEQGHFTHPTPVLEMEVLTTDPTSFTAYNDFTGHTMVDAYLNQNMYLAIFHRSSSQALTSLIPLYCQAKSTKVHETSVSLNRL